MYTLKSQEYFKLILGGHGRRSVSILRNVCGLSLTKDEWDAIRLHMHGKAPQMKTNQLAALVNRADHVSAGGRCKLPA